MLSRAVVNVSTGHYVAGQQRLRASLDPATEFICWTDALPPGSPPHQEIPYAFKAFAIAAAHERGLRYVLWADASINPIRPLDTLWALIEQQGYWISNNGWDNGEWTWPDAYADLDIEPARNWGIPHVVATAFGLDLRHPTGAAFFAEYLRLSKTRAFCGPWFNRRHPAYARHGLSPQTGECDDVRVRGHRHDQTAASVIAHRLGMRLTDPPRWIAYHPHETAETVLSVDARF